MPHGKIKVFQTWVGLVNTDDLLYGAVLFKSKERAIAVAAGTGELFKVPFSYGLVEHEVDVADIEKTRFFDRLCKPVKSQDGQNLVAIFD